MERFFGGGIGAVTSNAFAKPTLTEKSSGGKPVGVKSISVPLESLLQNYVVSYAELLNPGKKDEEHQKVEEDDDEEDNSERESNDDEEGEKAPQIDGEGEEKKEKDKKKKKKKKKKQQNKDNYDKFVGEYDLDDPFIDDDEVAVAYESVFDLMDFDGSDFDEDGEGSSFDSMDGEMDEAEREHRMERREKRRAAKKTGRDPSKPPLRDFYVYRGDLQVEVVSKLKDTGAKKTKKPTKVKAAPGSPKKKKKATVEKVESGAASLSAPKSPAKKKEKEKKPKPKAELRTLERIMALGEEPSATEKSTPKPSSSVQVSNEVSTKDSPEKQQARRHFDYGRVFAELEAKLALEAFIAKAKQMEAFEPSKFPSALRDLAAEVAVTGLRLHSSHSDVDDAVFVEMAKVVPYSVVALRKVVFKKIIPLLRQEATEKRLPLLYKELSEEASVLLNSNSENGSAPTDSQPDPNAAKATKFKFSEKARQIIYEIVKLELDLVFTGHALAVFEAAANGVAPPKPLAHEMTLRRPIYQSILKEWPSPADAPSSMEISSAYGMQKRKIERRLLKEHGVEMEQRPVEKRPHPLQLEESNGDVHVNVVDDSVADQPQAKEPRLLLLPEEPQLPSSQPPPTQQEATFLLLPELVNQQQ